MSHARPRFVSHSCLFAATLLACGTFEPSIVAAQTQESPGVQSGLDEAARALQEGRPADALVSLKRIEHLERDNPWLWFYRGLAQLQLGDWYRSMECLDQAQDMLTAHGDPDPTLSAGIREYRRRARNQVFSISYQTGLTYDGNVTYLGSGGAGLDISGRGDGKFTSMLRFEYAPIATATESFSFGARAANSWHFRIDEFDEQDYGATIHYHRTLGERWQAAVQYEYDVFYLGNEPYLSQHTVTPSVTYHWKRCACRLMPVSTRFVYRIDAREFFFDTTPDFDRDGYTNAVGVEQSFKFTPLSGREWTWDVYGSYFFESVATEGVEFDRLNHVFNAGFMMPLTNPWMPDKRLTFRFNAAWEIADYRNDSLIDFDADERSDLITALDVMLSQQLVTDPERGDVTLHAIVGWTNADSNVTLEDGPQPFTYEKWIAGLQLEWSW